MRQDTVEFGQEIGFGDIQKGQTILFPHRDITYKGVVISKAPDFFTMELPSGNLVSAYPQGRYWVVRELRIVEVNSLRHSQKPFAIQEDIDNGLLSKQAPDSDPGPSSDDTDWTIFPSLAKDFSSMGDAISYCERYLTSLCEVVFLAVRK